MSRVTDAPIKILTENRKARHDYFILETLEAGVSLTGAEVKSAKNGGLSIAESYVRPMGNELFILGAHIKPYSFSSLADYDPIRTKKLLLGRHDIDRLRGAVEREGRTIVALKAYLKRGWVKIEIGLAKGKLAPDKREAKRRAESSRDAERAIKRARR